MGETAFVTARRFAKPDIVQLRAHRTCREGRGQDVGFNSSRLLRLFHESHLRKVMIKGKYICDLTLFHDNIRNTIRE